MRATTLLFSGLLAVAAVGCGGPASTTSPSAAPTSAPAADFVTQVNTLCVKLVEDYLDATRPHPGSFPIAEYLSERAKVQPLIDEFDAQIDAIPVTATDGPAAEAFHAFRRLSDSTEEQLAVAAATGDQNVFDAAIDERHRTFDSSPVLANLGEVGITCNAR
jgi:hypothetical protein